MRNIIRKIYWDIAIYGCTGIILIGIMSVTVWRQNMTAQRKTTFRTYKVSNFIQGIGRFSRNEKNLYHEKNAYCFIKY